MAEFKFTPRQWVLVRDSKDEEWCLAQFSNYSPASSFGYTLCGGASFKCCIPYNDDTAHLLGKTDDYVESYEPKDGDFVYVKSKYGVPNNEIVFIHHYTDREGRIYTHAEYCFRGESSDGLKLIPTDAGFLIWKSGIKEIRPATETEKNFLLLKLTGVGKRWNAEKKGVVEYKWKPQNGETIINIEFAEIQKFFVAKFRKYDEHSNELTNSYTKTMLFPTTKEKEAREMVTALNEAIYDAHVKLTKGEKI